MTAAQAIYKLLTEDGPVSALVGTRVYPLYATQKFVAPYVTYTQVLSEPSNTKSGPSTLDTLIVQVNCVGKGYDSTADLAAKVRTALDYKSQIGVQQIHFESEVFNWAEGSQLQGATLISQDYKIFQER